MSRIIGIDLGTTNTCTAYVSNKIPRVIPTESGFNTMPSVVAFHPDGSIKVGQSAKEQMLLNPERTIYGIKRFLGRQYQSRVVQELVNYFAYTVARDQEGQAAVKIEDQEFSCAEIQSHILKQIKRYAEINLGEEIPDTVVAVPAYYNDHQRSLVKQAGTLAGWNVKRIVNEPTAAALAYGFNRGFDQRILIYDLGGGTFDVSILELTGNVFQVVATGGDMFLGGADFDARIQDWIVEQLRKQKKIDPIDNPTFMQEIRSAAERAKIELSLLANTQVRLVNMSERRGKTFELELILGRDTLNSLTLDLVKRTMTVVDQIIADANLNKNDINEIIPVGGQTRMPLVVDTLTSHFGKSPRKGIHPDECVAIGAALLGDSLAKIDAVTLLDTLSIPIGVPDQQGHLKVIIDKNIRLPHTTTLNLPTSKDNQTGIEIDIIQGEVGIPIAQAEYLGTLVYSDLPAKPAGSLKIQVEFTLDSEGMLSILASNSESDDQQKLNLATVERPQGSEESIEEFVSENVSEPQPNNRPGFKGIVRNLWSKK